MKDCMILLMTRVDVLVLKNLVEREVSLKRSGCEELWDGVNDIRGQG